MAFHLVFLFFLTLAMNFQQQRLLTDPSSINKDNLFGTYLAKRCSMAAERYTGVTKESIYNQKMRKETTFWAT